MFLRYLIVLGLLIPWRVLPAQPNYLERPDLMALADSCLRHTYDYSFGQARKFQQALYRETPDHPAPSFLEALIIYWEHFPLTLDDPACERFIHLMDLSSARAGPMIDQESSHLEGVFFDLFARAFKAMFWADNGKPLKILPDLRIMYDHTLEGFTLKERMPEFYFSTGLYNYYVEAYPEAHPVYKPILSFMQEGDRQLGLLQLNHSIYYSVYLRVEALQFMALIQLNYENDLNSAALYAWRLYQEYPANAYFQGLLVGILLHQHRYQAVREILAGRKDQEDQWSRMIRTLAQAFMEEKLGGSDIAAGKKYNELIEMADRFGPVAESYEAMGYMGLSRLYRKRGLTGEARRCEKKAGNYTVYRFILDEK